MLVTFALTCYNQQSFIRDAVRAALAQDYQPLEVLISDNHSTDATLDIIEEEIGGYAGPHSVRLIKQSRNIGSEIFPRTSEVARGEFIVGAHGDDISCASRTRCLAEAMRATKASLLSSNAEIIDADSRQLKFLNPQGEPKWISATEIARDGYTSLMHGATLAWHPDVFRSFGSLDRLRLRAAYDHVLPFRAGLLNGGYYVARPLVRWRIHGKNFGNEHVNRTRGPLVAAETGLASDLGARICMLDDLEYLVTNNRGMGDLSDLRDLLIARILDTAREWTLKRNELFAAGVRPTFISQAELEGHVAYSRGYFDEAEVGLRSIPKRLLRRVARILKMAKR